MLVAVWGGAAVPPPSCPKGWRGTGNLGREDLEDGATVGICMENEKEGGDLLI